jgi:hypothetical protein
MVRLRFVFVTCLIALEAGACTGALVADKSSDGIPSDETTDAATGDRGKDASPTDAHAHQATADAATIDNGNDALATDASSDAGLNMVRDAGPDAHRHDAAVDAATTDSGNEDASATNAAIPDAGGDTGLDAGADAAPKEPLHGLVAMAPLAFLNNPTVNSTPNNDMAEINVHPRVYVAAVINVTWAQLESTRGTYAFDAIESALSTIATYNATYPAHPVVGKLRVYAGATSPSWLTALAGGSATIMGLKNLITIPTFWTAGYKTEWQSLQQALAARYDADPRIAEIGMTSCMSVTAEPFFIPGDPTSIAALQAAGFDDQQFETCLSGVVDDYLPWVRTPVDYSFNPFRSTDGTQVVYEQLVTTSIMTAWRSKRGNLGVISNHDLDCPVTGNLPPLYTELSTLGPPMEFQAFGPTIPSWPNAIALGLATGASEIEIFPTTDAGGQAPITLAQLQVWATWSPGSGTCPTQTP